MLRIFVSVFMTVLLAQPASASTREEQAREMAECGYLAVIAAEDAKGTLRQNLVREVADFTNLYYAFAQIERPTHNSAGISMEMLKRMIEDGRSLHARRLAGMSQKNALRLSNGLLDTCRADLSMFAAKMRTNSGLVPAPAAPLSGPILPQR